MLPLSNILFVVNRQKPGAEDLSHDLSQVAERSGIQTEIITHYPVNPDMFKGQDLCVVVGGDGTLLGAVEGAAIHKVPVLGVNLGRLGFIASFSPHDIMDRFQTVLEGNFSSRSLAVLHCGVEGQPPVYALNDIVIKARSSRLIRLEVFCENEHMNTYNADGVIFSTPTGSTAYNLSAGGPIVHPSAKVIVATPINPHTLSNRAIVLDDSHTLAVHILGDSSDVQIAADGKEIFGTVSNIPIHIRVEQNLSFQLVQPDDYSHYFVLRSKLRWTGDAIFSPQSH